MIVSNFNTACVDYENFAIWEIKSMNEFLTGNGVFEEIFKTDYKMDISEFSERRSEIEQNDMQIIKNMLDQVGDKHFVIFTHHDPEHIELISMQDRKIMNFGMDINHILPENMYVLIMDKKA
jgi:hypothetical protein